MTTISIVIHRDALPCNFNRFSNKAVRDALRCITINVIEAAGCHHARVLDVDQILMDQLVLLVIPYVVVKRR